MLRTTLDRLRRVRIPRWVWLALLFLCACGAGLAVGAWRNLCADCPSIAQIYTYEPQQTSKIYARDSTLVSEIGLERRTPVALGSLPPHVPQAFIAIEDRRFYTHGGLDWKGIARAGLEVLRTRSLSGAGGSTITQQLARNMFTERIGFEKRVVRKLKEWQVALALEEAYSKDQIIEAYMNQIGYAHGWYGLQTASRNYFGKNAIDMNPAEAALLAAIANLPEVYSPLNDPDAATGRRNLVLDLMAQEGYLTDEEAVRWKQEPVPLERARSVTVQAPYFVEWVRKILDDRFGNKLYTAGLKVYTTLDLDMQEAAREAMEAGWARIEERAGFEHATFQEFSEEKDTFNITEIPYVQGMFIAADPQTGHVRAMIGGRDYVHSKFNRATDARRQAGSSFKPLVYAAALESGIPASEIIVDGPVVVEQADGTLWKPSNFDEDFKGPITIRRGLRESVNMVAIKLGMMVGLESVAQISRHLGIRTEVEPYESSAIGAAEVIPLQMLEAYSTFATLGTRVRPFPILKVENVDGDVLWEPRPETTSVLDSLVARLTVSLLEDVVAQGTGYTGIRLLAGLPTEVPAAGKTGTTNEGRDVWFFGFTPNLTAAVWFGMDMPEPIAPRATGGGLASPVWGEFMRRVYFGDGDEGEDSFPLLTIPEPWPIPDGLITRRVDSSTGLVASRWCPAGDAYDELYLPGTEPTEFCDPARLRTTTTRR
ncbi:MAG: PBP1A family penicillin-binding protein [Gemmatimonadetes bacterium]|nr:PBP1A family penicillin-binding protein [Gemmatimonadota bacterium]MYA65658.1 PBP1A family penicillin-binding protein [Gemmatimonadota bacterium]MYB97412.1 PBP1A family penicillin-binding protein [Gemmatimonadota bacterium]MYH54396.1 PBP1A family penicillin-binding protein [Gemmatimonadota bacterium]MYI46993.1 PBP1A family penicillin-binding protein [Gemmatimonadota bacterium]